MATTIKGPAIFLAQFAGDSAPFNSFDAICRWAASLGYKGVQIPTWDARLFDLAKATQSKTYCDEIAGVDGEGVHDEPESPGPRQPVFSKTLCLYDRRHWL